jgi:hypothetical protein
LDYEGTRYVFIQEASRWKVEEPAGKRWDLQTDMVALLDAIDPLESQGQAQPPPEAELGLDDPTLRVSAVTEGAVGEVTHGPLSVGAIQSGEQGLRYARIDGKDDVILVSQELIHAVREALRGIVDR